MSIDATWGGQYANSYITVTDASSMLPGLTLVASWFIEAVPQAREAALIQATRAIDQSKAWRGDRYYPYQLLMFPRSINIDWPWSRTQATSIYYGPQMYRMITQVQQATALQAVYMLQNYDSMQEHILNINMGIQRRTERVGPILDDLQYLVRSKSTLSPLSPEVASMLSEWISPKKVFRA